MIHAVRGRYPLFNVPDVEFITAKDDEVTYPVIADLDRWVLVIDPKYRSNPAYHLKRQLIILLVYHVSGRVMNPRHRLFREIQRLLEAA